MSTFQYFGETLRALRQLRGLTQAQLAARIGVSAKQISKYEINQQRPELGGLESLLAALDLSLGQFAGTMEIFQRLAEDDGQGIPSADELSRRTSAAADLLSDPLVPEPVEDALSRLLACAASLVLAARDACAERIRPPTRGDG